MREKHPEKFNSRLLFTIISIGEGEGGGEGVGGDRIGNPFIILSSFHTG